MEALYSPFDDHKANHHHAPSSAEKGEKNVEVWVRRVLVSKRPKKDRELEEVVLMGTDGSCGWIVFVPVANQDSPVPFYYPPVLAYGLMCQGGRVWMSALGKGEDDGRIASFLSRFGGELAKRAAKFTTHQLGGGYVKKFTFDTVIDRRAYDAVRAGLVDRHAAHLVDAWVESTDPQKHVFEDISIAAYVICLLEQVPSPAAQQDQQHGDNGCVDVLDLGTGNGVLVHILTEEGVRVRGIDLAARKSWTRPGFFSSQAQASLDCRPLHPPSDTLEDLGLTSVRLLLGNHADELCPWIPFLAARWDVPHWAIIPCCFFDFAQRYTHKASGLGRYETYCRYLVSVAHAAGHDIVREHIRIPSSKNAILLSASVLPPTAPTSRILFAQDADPLVTSSILQSVAQATTTFQPRSQ